MNSTLQRLVNALRKVASAKPIQKVLKRPRVEQFVSTLLRSSVVKESPRFAARELLHRKVTATYNVRDTDIKVVVRHRTPDVVTLDEVFYAKDYELPEQVKSVLDSAKEPKIVDLGSNIGLFTALFNDLYPNAALTAFEPDPINLKVLEQCMQLNGISSKLDLVKACASNKDGSVSFEIGGYSLSQINADSSSASSTAATLPMVDALPYIQNADLLKMDIEGGEWSILKDPRFAEAGVKTLVMEYHPHLCPGSNAKEEAEAVLKDAGYTLENIFSRDHGHGMFWGWKKV